MILSFINFLYIIIMTPTFDNNILQLNLFEATNIAKGETVPILFNIGQYCCSGENIIFDFEDSEPCYPVSVLEKEKNTVAEKYHLHSDSCSYDENNRMQTYQLATFWHFLGDATHCSEYVPTPFNFYPGMTINIENKYNVKPTPAYIKNIQLTRQNNEKWFWLVEIEKL